MSAISNSFIITALEDGSSLHGSLISIGSLAQAYNRNSGSCVPNWSVAANQPSIYLSLVDGTTPVPLSEISNIVWKYNNAAITFPSNNFQSYTYTNSGVSYTALKITNNLASSSNVDMDVITLEGTVTRGGAPVTFSASTQVRISEMTGDNAYFGTVSFAAPNGRNFLEDGQMVTMTGQLYGADGQPISSNVTYNWYLNGTKITATTGATATHVTGNTCYVAEADVEGSATIKCEMVYQSATKATVYETIDDQTDPEELYFAYGSESASSVNDIDNHASLRKGGVAYIKAWVGKAGDPTTHVKEWNTYDLILLDAQHNIIVNPTTSMEKNIPALKDSSATASSADYGVRHIAKNATWSDGSTSPATTRYYVAQSGDNQGELDLRIAYDTVFTNGKKNLTGILTVTKG